VKDYYDNQSSICGAQLWWRSLHFTISTNSRHPVGHLHPPHRLALLDLQTPWTAPLHHPWSSGRQPLRASAHHPPIWTQVQDQEAATHEDSRIHRLVSWLPNRQVLPLGCIVGRNAGSTGLLVMDVRQYWQGAAQQLSAEGSVHRYGRRLRFGRRWYLSPCSQLQKFE